MSTPAPWHWFPDYDDDSIVIGRHQAHSNLTRVVATIQHRDDEAEANARLIAAAPVLLEAARMVVRLKDEWKRKDESPQVDAEYLGRLLLSAEVARAAVAQAEGGNDE